MTRPSEPDRAGSTPPPTCCAATASGVELDGPPRRVRAIVPEDAVDVADLLPLLTDSRWQE